MKRRTLPLRLPVFLIAALTMAMLAAPGGTSAQTGTAVISFNAWSCPSDYDQISECTKLDGVSVRVYEDGETAGDLTSAASSSADLEVAAGAEIFIELLGGAPASTLLEPVAHEFNAVEGVNPLTFVFVSQVSAQEPVDSDSDGLTDEEEAELGTDPTNPDTDDDGVQDGGEINAGTDPLNPDTDDDGFIDRVEMDLGTDPLDPTSYPVDTEPNSLTITAYTCPVGYEGKELFDDCTEPLVGVDFVFFLNASEFGLTGRTDATGTVSFEDLGGGEYTLQMDMDDLDYSLMRYTAICFAEPLSPDAPEPRQVNAFPLENGAYGFELTANEDITCTWFNIPADGDSAPEPPKAPVTDTPVKRLPTTGTGSYSRTIADMAFVSSAIAAALSLAAAGAAWHTRRK